MRRSTMRACMHALLPPPPFPLSISGLNVTIRKMSSMICLAQHMCLSALCLLVSSMQVDMAADTSTRAG